jgi:RNA polymerase sigma-70 factor (ECF subfamily)
MTAQHSGARLAGPTEPAEPGAAATHELPPFESIYEKYFDFVWAATRRLGVQSASIDDVVQEIFMVIHSKTHTVRQPESLRSWIYGIVRRTVSDYHRSQRVRDASGIALAVQTSVERHQPPTPADLTEQSDQVRLLYSLLEEIDEPKREVFMLAELEEMTVPEIAEILEIPLNTAYSRLRAARLAFDAGVARRAARREGGTPWRS